MTYLAGLLAGGWTNTQRKSDMTSKLFIGWQQSVATLMNSFSPEKQDAGVAIKMAATTNNMLASQLKMSGIEIGNINRDENALKALIISVVVMQALGKEMGVHLPTVMDYIYNNVDISEVIQNMSLDNVDLSGFIKQE